MRTLLPCTLTAVFVKDSQGGYSAYIEELSGVNTQGETIAEARANLKEALELVLEANKALRQAECKSNLILKEPFIELKTVKL